MTEPSGIDWPAALLARAEVTGSGEPLWAAGELPAAIDWVESRSLAIFAIEVFGRVERARGVFQRELGIEPPRRERETWANFVARSAVQAREQLAADLAGGEASAADLYFLAVVPEPEG